MIRPDGVKVEKEKFQGVVNWLVLRSVKDVQILDIQSLDASFFI